MEQKKGSTMLKVVSILLIVFGGISVITSLLSIAAIAGLIYLGVGSAILYLALVLSIVGCVVELIAGITGVSSYAKPEKADKMFKLGIIMVAIQVLAFVINLIGGMKPSIVSFLIGLVLPVLYILGVKELQK